jgi:hypothetical protein
MINATLAADKRAQIFRRYHEHRGKILHLLYPLMKNGKQ